MSGRLFHRLSCSEQSHRTRHGSDILAADGYTIRRSTKDDLVLAASLVLFGAAITDRPARISKKSSNPAIAITPILSGKFDHISNQPVFICTTMRHISLRRPVLLQHMTSSAFRDTMLLADFLNAGAATGGA